MKATKPLMSLLLALLLILPMGTAALATEAENSIPIYTVEELLAIANAPDGSYTLEADLDLFGIDWSPFAFSGTLDGQGHTLYNLQVSRVGEDVRQTRDGNLKVYDTVFAGLFSVLEEATIRDLTLLGAALEVDGETHCFAGLLAGYMDHSSVLNCTVQGTARLNNYAVQSGVAGLVGYGCGEIKDCRAAVTLIFEDRNFDSRCEQFLGGVLSCGIANIENCEVEIDGYDSCHGYAHSGGLVGMYYYCGMNFRGLSVTGNSVKGHIHFFEDNRDRRAYCAPYLGEPLSMPGNYNNNTEEFTRDETREYGAVLLPERCETPEIQDTVTPSGCESWGYTDHACAKCEHRWRDSYTPPRHTPGDWETAREATEDAEGLQQRHCRDCGELLETQEIPRLAAQASPAPSDAGSPGAAPQSIESSETLAIRFRGHAQASYSSAATPPLYWESANPEIASVNETGLIFGLQTGETQIYYRSADGLCCGVCEVTVYYSLWQWFLILFCFGWLWYI